MNARVLVAGALVAAWLSSSSPVQAEFFSWVPMMETRGCDPLSASTNVTRKWPGPGALLLHQVVLHVGAQSRGFRGDVGIDFFCRASDAMPCALARRDKYTAANDTVLDTWRFPAPVVLLPKAKVRIVFTCRSLWGMIANEDGTPGGAATFALFLQGEQVPVDDPGVVRLRPITPGRAR